MEPQLSHLVLFLLLDLDLSLLVEAEEVTGQTWILEASGLVEGLLDLVNAKHRLLGRLPQCRHFNPSKALVSDKHQPLYGWQQECFGMCSNVSELQEILLRLNSSMSIKPNSMHTLKLCVRKDSVLQTLIPLITFLSCQLPRVRHHLSLLKVSQKLRPVCEWRQECSGMFRSVSEMPPMSALGNLEDSRKHSRTSINASSMHTRGHCRQQESILKTLWISRVFLTCRLLLGLRQQVGPLGLFGLHQQVGPLLPVIRPDRTMSLLHQFQLPVLLLRTLTNSSLEENRQSLTVEMQSQRANSIRRSQL